MSEREPESDDSRKALRELWPHAVVSLVYLIAMAIVWMNTQPYSVEANDVGDYMSGMFAPLAFYWLILGYYLQRQELGLQRRELRLNREQLEAQADELKRQADATNALIVIEERAAQRQQVHDKVETLPQRVFKLVSCYKRFHKVGNRKPNGDFSITFTPTFPEQPVPQALRLFSEGMLSSASRWKTTYENDHGSLIATLRSRNPEAFLKLETEFRTLMDWWEGCRSLTRLTGMDALAAKGDECGIESLLSATALCLNIAVMRAETTLGPLTGTSTATVSTPNK